MLLAASKRCRAWPQWARYAGASALALLAYLVQLALRQDIPPHLFLLAVPAVLFSVLLFGGNPGVWSTVLSAALTSYFLLEPRGFAISNPVDAMALVLFIGASLLIVYVLEDSFRTLETARAETTTIRDAAERLAESGRMKDLLLQDMAHRTKNDLQLLSSMLQIEGRTIEDGRCRASLLSAASRILVVGRVHSLLQRGGSHSVEMQPLIDELCADLRVSLIGVRPIALRAEVDNVLLPLDAARSIALIVNELLTNALKHAFPGDRPGMVTIRLTCDGDTACLVVEDDGVGAATEAEPRSKGAGFGQKLVRSLAQQLGGVLTIVGEPTGTRCELRFPARPK